jgi:hypothetical protein
MLTTRLFYPELYTSKNSNLNLNSNPNKINSKKNNINDLDRIKTIEKCDRISSDLEKYSNKKDYEENKKFLDSIKQIVNDSSFSDKKDLKKIKKALKRIQKQLKEQSENISHSNNEVIQMLIQKIMNESSNKSIHNSDIANLLREETNQNEILQKYIVKIIKKEFLKEKEKYPIESQTINVLESSKLKSKIDLIDTTIDKLNSMESLYNKIHMKRPENKKHIVSLVQPAVSESIRANTIYIKE